MEIPYTVVHAFVGPGCRGNPAGVCRLGAWLPAERMQAIAADNNLSETSFVVRGDAAYDLRWFTPTVEVDLCGHATLATAFVLLEETGRDRVEFDTRSGRLLVERRDDRLVLDLPARPSAPIEAPPALAAALGRPPREVLRSVDVLAVYDDEDDVRAVTPDFRALAPLPTDGVIVTAPGRDVDFVSRYFCPGAGIEEDPVTGAAHCTLVPFWARRLGRASLHARQVSSRGGELFGEDRGDRCRLAGRARRHLDGRILLPDA
ncbi:MAG: PhzF family phenazine biosynthesis protein [Planctomycetota bacterium]|jgi:PhzF family phenazine biosynthesis protein